MTDPTPTNDAPDELGVALDAMQEAIDSRPVVIGIVLDRSGSMESVREATISGFNEFKQEQQRLPGTALLTLTLFDTEFEIVHQMRPLDEVPDLDRATYAPRGMTALYDGIGITISSIDKSIANLPERPSRVVLVIMTDGGENSSKEHTRVQINALLDEKRNAAEPWDIVFLGANQDAFEAGAQMGVARNTTVNYAATAQGTKSAYAGVSSYVGRSRMMASSKAAGANAFTDAERTIIGDPTDATDADWTKQPGTDATS